jgi:heme/copper-type cytochrome/quinol oxidase subunit 3
MSGLSTTAASASPDGLLPRGRVIPLRRPGEVATAWLGMVVFLGSWAMMFAGLFFAYGLVRLRSPAWPPLDQPPLPLLLPGVNVAVVLLSEGALVLALRWLRGGKVRPAAAALAGATLLGATFLALQSVVWVSLWNAGLRPDGGPYPSVFYALTSFHALHVLVGLAALAWLAARALAGNLGPARRQALRLWAMYWHFVGAVWVAMYLAVYVV